MTLFGPGGLLLMAALVVAPEGPESVQTPPHGLAAVGGVPGDPAVDLSNNGGPTSTDPSDAGGDELGGAETQHDSEARLPEPVDAGPMAARAESVTWPTGAHPSFSWAGMTFTARGFAQVDAVLLSQASYDELNASTGQPLNERSISLRRLRVRAEVSRWIFSAAAELEASTVGGLSLRPYAAELAVRWPATGEVPLVKLSGGLVCMPFGRDVRLAVAEPLDRFFFEPSTMARALFPGSFDLGIRLSGGWRFLRYEFAVMNGEPVGELGLPAKDPNAAKDFMGRLGFVTPPSVVTLKAGVSGLWGVGFHPGTPSTKDTLAWHDANEDGQVQSTELQVVGGLPSTPSKDFDRFALGADLELAVAIPVLGTLAITGELVWAKNLDRALFVADPVALGRDTREVGWVVGLTQQLPWGFALGVRFDRYLPDADAADQEGAVRVPFDSSLSTWSFVAAWRWQRTARLLVQYEHQRNALGRGLDGTPTTLGSDRLAIRAEVAF